MCEEFVKSNAILLKDSSVKIYILTLSIGLDSINWLISTFCPYISLKSYMYTANLYHILLGIVR